MGVEVREKGTRALDGPLCSHHSPPVPQTTSMLPAPGPRSTLIAMGFATQSWHLAGYGKGLEGTPKAGEGSEDAGNCLGPVLME